MKTMECLRQDGFVWDDNWYYADKTGAVQTGWIMDQPGKYYYLNEDGTMAHDTVCRRIYT